MCLLSSLTLDQEGPFRVQDASPFKMRKLKATGGGLSSGTCAALTVVLLAVPLKAHVDPGVRDIAVVLTLRVWGGSGCLHWAPEAWTTAFSPCPPHIPCWWTAGVPEPLGPGSVGHPCILTWGPSQPIPNPSRCLGSPRHPVLPEL